MDWCRLYWQSWAHLCYIKVQVHVQTQIVSLVPGDVPSLLYETPRMILEFLPERHKLKYATMVEVHYCISQPCVQFAGLPHFHSVGPLCALPRTQTCGSLKGPNVDWREVGGGHFPVLLIFPNVRCAVWWCPLLCWRITCLFIERCAMKCISQLLEYQNIVNCVDSFLSGQEINSIPPSAS
jgi:hypothetical protein